jgi:hypothetical protein
MGTKIRMAFFFLFFVNFYFSQFRFVPKLCFTRPLSNFVLGVFFFFLLSRVDLLG